MEHSSLPYYEEINLQQCLEVNYFFVFTSNIRKILQLDEYSWCQDMQLIQHLAVLVLKPNCIQIVCSSLLKIVSFAKK